MKGARLIVLVMSVLIAVEAACQDLSKEKLTKQERKEGVKYKYSYCPEFDGYSTLLLYSNGNYEYYVVSRRRGLNKGKWMRDNDELLLTCEVDRDSIPITVNYLQTNSEAKWVKKTIVDMPMTEKGDRLSDSKVFINNDSSYFFPFFDTCVGCPIEFDSLKVSFGNGYTSKWVPIKDKNFKLLSITTNVDLELLQRIYFKRRKYLIKDNRLVRNDD